jgi:predicted nucleotidyltransferase
MLEALFSSSARIRLLRILLLEPGGRFYLRELAKKAGVQVRSVQVELRKLTAAGILVNEVSGRQTYYRINEDCPIVPDLRAIFVKTAGVADVLRSALAGLSDRIDVAFIYGSFAAGSERADSDIDLMIIGSATLREAVPALGSTERELRREVNPSVFSREEFRERALAEEHFVSTVLAEAKVFVIGDEHELAGIAGRR